MRRGARALDRIHGTAPSRIRKVNRNRRPEFTNGILGQNSQSDSGPVIDRKPSVSIERTVEGPSFDR